MLHRFFLRFRPFLFPLALAAIVALPAAIAWAQTGEPPAIPSGGQFGAILAIIGTITSIVFTVGRWWPGATTYTTLVLTGLSSLAVAFHSAAPGASIWSVLLQWAPTGIGLVVSGWNRYQARP